MCEKGREGPPGGRREEGLGGCSSQSSFFTRSRPGVPCSERTQVLPILSVQTLLSLSLSSAAPPSWSLLLPAGSDVVS
ncbi:hypothetical protein LX32DRAFT_640666 [Colletotrichum zoysiae]|uniref:Uncharacterized protein n=1 Tax=Colletotrichum zoysiae TaxID=1216348 RepID=A0AAD9HGU8_9PEZI|nr:hypothetical protein LX32DRAFT_640666 [Colletotrichum zoysiae]